MFMLSEEKIASYRKKLEGERKQLAAELAKQEAPEDFGNDVDAFDEETDEATAFANQVAVGQSVRDRMNEIDAALNRMATGEYGLCTKCNNRISDEVLAAAPESALCENCKLTTRKK